MTNSLQHCEFCGSILRRRVCCPDEKLRRKRKAARDAERRRRADKKITKPKSPFEPNHHRCVECGVVSSTYRCGKCTENFRIKHDYPANVGSVDDNYI